VTQDGVNGAPDELVHRTVLSPNFNARKCPISMVVLHYTEMPLDGALARMCDPEAEVSAHYCIAEAGEVIRLVPESERAWHAGKSCWRGMRDINSASIGIELDHPGHAGGYRAFAEPQIDALLPLLARMWWRIRMSRRGARSIRANCFHGGDWRSTACAWNGPIRASG